MNNKKGNILLNNNPNVNFHHINQNITNNNQKILNNNYPQQQKLQNNTNNEVIMNDLTKEENKSKSKHSEGKEYNLSAEEISLHVKNGESKLILTNIANNMMDDMKSKLFFFHYFCQ